MYKYDVNRGLYKIKTRAQKLSMRLSTGLAAVVAAGAFAIAPAGAAAPSTIYNNIPKPLPPNVSSEGPEAYAFAELGGQVHFDGTARNNPTVTVAMSSWACQTGHWYDGTCSTPTSDTFSYPITLNAYAVGSGGQPGTKIATATKTFAMPYRPSSGTCTTDSTAYLDTASGECFHGKAFTISFDLSGTLPDNAIFGVAYNSTHYGYVPVGESAACFSSSAGCFYDSLNIGLNSPPTVGSDPLPNDAYLFSNVAGAYCAGDQATTGTFRIDHGCWTGFQPAIKVEAKDADLSDQCKNNGWKNIAGHTFKNQGDCVSFYATNGKNLPSGT
jgi:hypothetical protein